MVPGQDHLNHERDFFLGLHIVNPVFGLTEMCIFKIMNLGLRNMSGNEVGQPVTWPSGKMICKRPCDQNPGDLGLVKNPTSSIDTFFFFSYSSFVKTPGKMMNLNIEQL